MTRAGSAFKRHVDAMLHQLDDGLAAVEHITDPETGTLALGFQMSLGTWLVPDLVSSFRAEHPQVHFSLSQVRDEAIDTVLAQGDADLVLSTVRPTDPTIERRRLLDEPLRLAVAADHPLAQQPSVRLSDAASEPFLMLNPSTLLRRVTDELCLAAGFEPTVSFESEDVHTIRGFVEAGLGVALIPASGERSAGSSARRVRYLSVTDVHAVREISLTWSADRRLLPAAELFREHIINRARAGRLPAGG